jgi:2-oxoglutarate ferredoxin oxidoreductase subunit alpha
VEELAGFRVHFRTDREGFLPYGRDERTLARPWAVPGTPGLEHRVGGLEKSAGTGNVSYDPINHERMVRLRSEKIERAAQELPEAVPEGPGAGGLLVVGWGSTYGAITSAVQRARAQDRRVSHLHLRHLNPLPRNLGGLLEDYDHVLVPEINLGQLAFLLRGRFGRPVEQLNKVQGLPFTATEIERRILELTEG